MREVINLFNHKKEPDPFEDPLEFLKFDAKRLITDINIMKEGDKDERKKL